MHMGRNRIVVLSKNSGSLFGYAGALNKLGYYSVSLCVHVRELVGLLEVGAHFEYLIYDGFDLGKNAEHLKMLAEHNAIASIIAVADVNSLQHKKIILGSKAQGVPLQGVLQGPLRLSELHELIQLPPINADFCCAAPELSEE